MIDKIKDDFEEYMNQIITAENEFALDSAVEAT